MESAGGTTSGTIIVINMGAHLLPRIDGPQLLFQVTVPGLADRARALPFLTSLALSPGKVFLGGQLCMWTA